MATGKRPDPRRGGKKHPPASNLKVPNGTKAAGYKAGEIFGCYGHRIANHVPCLTDVTDGALKCPYCPAGNVPVWRGYVPVWDTDFCLRYALIGENYFESAEAIKWGEAIEFERKKNPISPLMARPGVGFLRALPDRAPWNTPVSMLDVCLTLWQDDLLTRWFAKNPVKRLASDNAPSLRTDGKPFSPMMQAPAKRYAAPGDAEPAADALDEVQSKLAKRRDALKASENGNGKH